jgi:fatty-acyl-CoA synthase
VIEQVERLGFSITHLYGLTETYGPATLCAWQHDWDGLDLTQRSGKMARQGVAMPTQQDVTVLDTGTAERVAADGTTVGEIAIRGNTVMKGYLKNPQSTEEAFQGGWFRSGDLAVLPSRRLHRDQGPAEGHHHLRRREHLDAGGRGGAVPAPEGDGSGGRRQARREVGRDAVRLRHAEAGVDDLTADEIVKWCRANLAAFKCPKHVVFGELPKTSTGKVQKFVLRERAKAI